MIVYDKELLQSLIKELPITIEETSEHKYTKHIHKSKNAIKVKPQTPFLSEKNAKRDRTQRTIY